jgi:rare lipoprotein A
MKNNLKPLLYVLIFFLPACSTNHPHELGQRIPCGSYHQPDGPHYEPLCRYGNPECYAVEGQKYYVLKTAEGYCKTGLASWYGTKFHGRNTSSREPYDMFGMTAASRNLPLPTYVEVTNLENGKKVIVKVNDRGPFKSDRIIDLSFAAASQLGFANRGTASVQVRALNRHEVPSSKIHHEVILASNDAAPDIQINQIVLPTPEQAPKSIRLERYLQLGAFSNRDNANRLKTDIAACIQENILIKEGSAQGKSIYRVQIGPFKDVEQSTHILQRLKEKGYKDVITVFS